MSEKSILNDWDTNPMRMPRISSVTVNIGVGVSGEKLNKALTVLETITGQKPVATLAKKNIRDFSIKAGERIGAKVTLRGSKAEGFLKKALEVVEFRIPASQFDQYGNVSFGIKEHIELSGAEYDPEIGIFGMDVCIALERPGYRIKRRRNYRRKVPLSHRVSRDEAILFMKKKFGVKTD
ncbi:MAG: 50S ribosomal protein L5 [Candidatus Odinarchaeota archaeon]